MRQEQCRSCHLPIVWAHTLTGNLIPIDWDPVADGNVLIRAHADRIVAVVMQPNFTPPEGENRYHAHFVTCPDAMQWRKRNR